MERIAAYIGNYGQGADLPDASSLKSVLEQYPWFVTARILEAVLSKNGEADILLWLHLGSFPYPEVLTESRMKDTAMADSPTGTIIDAFLMSGEQKKIVPREDTTDEDAASGSAVFEVSDDTATEELAEIYLAQGLNEQAREIYLKLSLLYPEKSVYFAEIIDRIASEKTKK